MHRRFLPNATASPPGRRAWRRFRRTDTSSCPRAALRPCCARLLALLVGQPDRCATGESRGSALPRGICAYFSVRPETAASRPHTDYSRVDRVESVAPLDAKRPYSTLMFNRKERKGRKRKNWLIVAMGPFCHEQIMAPRPFDEPHLGATECAQHPHRGAGCQPDLPQLPFSARRLCSRLSSRCTASPVDTTPRCGC